MTTRNAILRQMLRTRLVAVIRFDEGDTVDAAIEAIVEGGITTIEITLTTHGALQALERWHARPGLLLGAGTVLSAEDAGRAIHAGARFIASPAYDPAVVGAAHAENCVAMPGALTPTEILAAFRGDGDLIKVFPMPTDGPAYIRAIAKPLPGIPLCPSGGVTPDSALDLLKAGASVLNVGTWLTHQPDGTLSHPEEITHRARALRSAIADFGV